MANPDPGELRIVLHPRSYLAYDFKWTCKACAGHYYFVFDDGPEVCVLCEFTRAGKDKILVMGWTIHKSKHQVICARL